MEDFEIGGFDVERFVDTLPAEYLGVDKDPEEQEE